MNQKGFALLEIILVVVAIGLLTYGGYSFWNNKKIDIKDNQQVEDNIKVINQNPVQLHEIKMKAIDDINKINQQTKEQASSTNNYLE